MQGRIGSRPPAVFVAFPAGRVDLDDEARAVIERYTGRLGTFGWERVERAIAAAARRFAFGQTSARSQVLWPGLRVDFAIIPPRPREKMRLAGFLVEETRDEPERDAAVAPALVEAVLSPRELAVARRFASGMDLPSIAEALRVGEETARTHLRSAYRKLRVAGRAELAKALAYGT